MLKETDMRTAIMATLDGETAYAMRFEGDCIYTMTVGKCRLDYLTDQGHTHRFLIDEPEEPIEIVPENTVTITAEDISDIYAGEPEDLPFTPEKSELEGFATYDPTVKRKGGRYPKVDVGKLMALHNAGWDEDKIAGELGVTRGTVMRYLREEGTKDD